MAGDGNSVSLAEALAQLGEKQEGGHTGSGTNWSGGKTTTYEEVVQMMRDLGAKLGGKGPTIKQWDEAYDSPKQNTVHRRWGWANVIEAAGLRPSAHARAARARGERIKVPQQVRRLALRALDEFGDADRVARVFEINSSALSRWSKNRDGGLDTDKSRVTKPEADGKKGS